MIKQNQRNKLLLDIIEKNENTEYGRKFHFDYLRTVDGFRFNVPLTKYRDVQPLIELTTRIGESKIYAEDKLSSYALTSGTSEINHFVPCTERHISSYTKEFLKILKYGNGDKVVLFSSIPHEIIYFDQAKLDTITGTVLQKIRPELKKYHITTPETLLYVKEHYDMLYYRTLFALRSSQVDEIIAPFSWNVISMVYCIIERHDDFIHDLRTGEITFDKYISDNLKSELQSAFSSSTDRADLLEKIFENDDTSELLIKIWPKLKRIVAAGTGRFEIYKYNLKPFIGDVEYSNGFLASSEAIVGCALPGTDIYKMYEGNAYLEFLPVESASKETVLFDEVEIGKEYVVYVTNYSGLYRYKIGDIVEITDVKDGIPYFRYSRRTNEIISEATVYQAIKAISKEFGMNIRDYCYEVVSDTGNILIYLETEETDKVNPDDIVKHFPLELKVCDVKYIPVGAQYRYKCLRGINGNMASDQLKPIRLLDSNEKKEFFEFSQGLLEFYSEKLHKFLIDEHLNELIESKYYKDFDDENKAKGTANGITYDNTACGIGYVLGV